MNTRRRGFALHAFTLIELLVVVTIIVVLLALLVPAMDKAIYRAELTVCAATLKGLGGAVSVYGADSKRQYPYRPRVRGGASGARPEEIRTVPPVNPAYDDRQTLRGYLSIQKNMQCPMTAPANMETTNALTQVFSSYQHWYGWQFANSTTQYRGMFKLGDKFGFETDRFSVLASDCDFHDSASPNYVQAAHPDREGGTTNITQEDVFNVYGNYTYSMWVGTAGTADRNFAIADGSVRTLMGLKNDDAATEITGEDGQKVVRVSTRCNETANGTQTTFLPPHG